MKFKEYEEKVKLFKQFQVFIPEELPTIIKNVLISELHQKLSQDDTELSLYFFFESLKTAPIFKNPHFWFLPFHKNNRSISKLLSFRKNLISPSQMEDLLYKSISLSSSEKYSICYSFEKLRNEKISELCSLLLNEQKDLNELIINNLHSSHKFNF